MEDIRSAQEIMPWMLPISDGLVVCKDSSLLGCFEFVGADADSAGDAALLQISNAADRLMMSLRDLPVTIWWTLRREKSEDYCGEPMGDAIAQLIDDQHRASYLANSAYVNRHFFSIIWMPERSTAGMFEKAGVLMGDGVNPFRAVVSAIQATYFGKGAFAWKSMELERAVEEFEGRLRSIQDIMSILRFRRLEGQEMLGFLWSMANPGSKMAPKAWDGQHYLDGLLPEAAVNVYKNSLTFGDVDPVHANLMSMKTWPTPIAFGAFDTLVSLPTEMVVSHCFRVMGTVAAEKHADDIKKWNDILKYPLTTWIFGIFKNGAMNESKANPARALASAEAMAAKGVLTSGESIFGHHNLSIMLLDRDEERLEASTQAMARMLAASPFTGVIREGMHALSAWATTLPGQWQECRRWMGLMGDNVNAIAPLMGIGMGDRFNGHLTEQLGKTCQALTVLPTDYNTPFYFNFHVGALGHAFVVGPSRSGKSIGMNFFLSQLGKYNALPNRTRPQGVGGNTYVDMNPVGFDDVVRRVIFDKDHSCRIPTLLQGGEHIDLRPDGEVKVNPFVMLDDRRHWQFLTRWTEGLIGSRGYKVSAEDHESIYQAIEQTAAQTDSSLHVLATVRTFLPGNLGVHLDEWIGTGQNAFYFDNEMDSFSVSGFTCIEMGEIMKEPRAAVAFLDYAFYRIQRMLEDQRTSTVKFTCIYVEECAFVMQIPEFVARLKDWLKTFAKLNAFLVLCTQSPEDLIEVPASVFAAIRDNIATKIFLPAPQAQTESLYNLYKTQFALRDDVIEKIVNGRPKRDYVIVQPELCRKVNMRLTDVQVAALRSDIRAQREFQLIYEDRHGRPEWRYDYINRMLEVAEEERRLAA